MSLVKLGRVLREARLASRLSQSEVGRRLGLSRTSITNMEAGRQEVTFSALCRWGDATGVDPGDLVSVAHGQRNVKLDDRIVVMYEERLIDLETKIAEAKRALS